MRVANLLSSPHLKSTPNFSLLLFLMSFYLFFLLPAPTLQLVRAFQQPSECIPTPYPPDCTSPPPTLRQRHYPILKSEILHLTHHIGTLHPSSPTIDITCVTINVRSFQIGVDDEDNEMMLIEETFCLFCTCCAVQKHTIVPQRRVWPIHCPKMREI